MKNKIIFIDIDGTLVEAHKHVSQLNVEAIDKARANGHIVFLCTGRNRCSISSDVQGVKVDGVICSAGSYIEIDGVALHHNYIDDKIIKDICNLMNEASINHSLEGTHHSYFSKDMAKSFALEGISDDAQLEVAIKEIYEMMNGKDMDTYQNEGIHKVSFIAQHIDQLKDITKKYENDFTFVYHTLFGNNKCNGEMIVKHQNKATGIQFVLNHLNLNQKDTIGIGDSMNDYEMLEYVDFAIAMETAPDVLKKHAKYIAKHASEDAIYHAFIDLGIID